jgi:hypothetical protein
MLSAKVGALRRGVEINRAVSDSIDEAEEALDSLFSRSKRRPTQSAMAAARGVGRDVGRKLEAELQKFSDSRIDNIVRRLNEISDVKITAPKREPVRTVLGKSVERMMEDVTAAGVERAAASARLEEPNASKAFVRMRAHVKTVSRSAANAAHNAAVLAVARANKHAINGVLALATLDSVTTHICRSRHGGAWDINTNAPLVWSPSQIQFPGRPPWHWNCRTTLSPLFIGMGIPENETMDRDAWLASDDARSALGEESVDMYRAGLIDRDQLLRRTLP